ncbi:hypothetical protein BC828DRAFT_382157 [Blastocladiella britannica]|nr:hypothetical protein BC828DRAFT_382157 [Blastocladiella britannica]
MTQFPPLQIFAFIRQHAHKPPLLKVSFHAKHQEECQNKHQQEDHQIRESRGNNKHHQTGSGHNVKEEDCFIGLME